MEEHCGGYNVSVEIFQFPTSLEWEPLKCKTKAWKYFKAGDTLIFDHKKASYPCRSHTFIQFLSYFRYHRVLNSRPCCHCRNKSIQCKKPLKPIFLFNGYATTNQDLRLFATFWYVHLGYKRTHFEPYCISATTINTIISGASSFNL